MAPCCGPGLLTAPWSGSMVLMKVRHHPMLAKVLEESMAGRSAPSATSAACCFSKQAHRSSSDDEARLFKKAPGVGAFLSFMGHCFMENRNGLVVASEVSQSTGRAERDSALRVARSLQGAHQKTLGADKGYDTRDFAAICASAASRRMSHRTSVGAVDQHLMAARTATRATPNRSTPGSGSSRYSAGSNRQLASGTSRGGIKGGGGVPAACGGLQPDPHYQTAQGPGGAGMKAAMKEPRHRDPGSGPGV